MQERDTSRRNTTGTAGLVDPKLDGSEDHKQRPQPLVSWRGRPEAQYKGKQDDEPSGGRKSMKQEIHLVGILAGLPNV
jgi:hypothetical protein